MESSAFHVDIQTDSGMVVTCTYEVVCSGTGASGRRYGIDCYIEGGPDGLMTRCCAPDLFPSEEQALELARHLARGRVFPVQVRELLEEL